MTYTVKEIFYTLQGEGANTGRAAVFCRFSGCNLWSGREADRATAVCTFCDTDFVGVNDDGGRFRSPEALAQAVAAAWPHALEPGPHGERGAAPRVRAGSASRARPLVVCTGGEPLLQLDAPLVDAFHRNGFELAVETNGTQRVPAGVDWVCVSPKSNAPLVVDRGNELKLVFPQADAMPDRFAALDFEHFFLQPMDGPALEANTREALAWCLAHPQWRLGMQTHKLIGVR